MRELRAEIPFQKWHDGIDRFIVLAVAVSVVAHFSALTAMRWLPAPALPASVITAKFVPEFTDVPEADLPDATPAPAVSPKRLVPAPGGAPGPATAGDPTETSLLRVLRQNADLLAMITRDGADNGVALALRNVPADGASPSGPVRVAIAGDRLPAGAEPAAAVPVSMAEIGVPRPAPVAIAERQTRRLELRMSRPTTDAPDAETNRLVRQALRAKLGAVKYCYERALKGDRTLAGKVTLQVVFSSDGAAAQVHVLADGLGDPSVSGCMAAKLRDARTTAPLGRPATVRVPYVFALVE